MGVYKEVETTRFMEIIEDTIQEKVNHLNKLLTGKKALDKMYKTGTLTRTKELP